MEVGNDTTFICIARWAFFGLLVGASFAEIVFSDMSSAIYAAGMSGAVLAVLYKVFAKKS